jgi:hypothetical protein
MSGDYCVDMPPDAAHNGYVCWFQIEPDTREGIVVDAAPVMRRWIGQPAVAYANWARRRGAVITRLR